MRRALVKILLCSGLAFGTTQGRAATANVDITDIQPIVIDNRPITLHPAGFPAVTITPLWRENGNAWSYDLYAVSTRDTEQPARSSLVDTEDPDNGGQLLDMLRDIPHTGEDTIQTIHFASSRANGKPASCCS